MKWKYLNKASNSVTQSPNKEEVIEILLKNRGIETEKERQEFLSPSSPSLLAPSSLGIDNKQLDKALVRIYLAIKNEEPIVVYGDYDVDGICSTAILWETLRDLGAKVMPFIPQREKEGYGLSIEGIKVILQEEKYGITNKTVTQSPNKSIKPRDKKGLLITVDNGIVAHEAVDFANANGLDVVIVDHHEVSKKLPKALAIIHTLELCAAGIAYYVSRELYSVFSIQYSGDSKLELACIASVADLVPLVGPNRSIVKFGLEALSDTTRPGLLALFKVAGIEKVGTYEIGYLIGPRINASGRIENALTALRLLCTKDAKKALEYAELLNSTNKERQDMTAEMTLHALEVESGKRKAGSTERIIIIEHETYHQGVIGLIAGKLVEKYYLPAIVISKGELMSKASARSISGFNIIEAIRESSSLLLNAGGHPMAAGFTIETNKITSFKLRITNYAKGKITDDLLERSLRIDVELPLEAVGMPLFQEISKLSPHGIGNPEPVFASEAKVQSLRTVGADGKHLKLVIASEARYRPVPGEAKQSFDAIAFNFGHMVGQIKVGEQINLAYSIVLDTFNGNNKVQLKVKDIQK